MKENLVLYKKFTVVSGSVATTGFLANKAHMESSHPLSIKVSVA
jgi:hypothetical protein